MRFLNKITPAAVAAVLAATLFAAVSAQITDTAILRGMVVDAKDDPVQGARISTSEGTVCFSDRDGSFRCRVKDASLVTITVSAEGFREYSGRPSAPFDSVLRIVLEVLPLREDVVVSASGSPSAVGDTAASVISVSKEEINVTASVGTDEILRQIPGFTLFRRSSGRTANPTTQGASLRGVNPSGASRSLVLVDGVPLNDPFGGWIQWAGIPPVGIESVEVLRGGASSLYGSDSIGGTITIRQRTADSGRSFSGEAFGGSQDTAGAAFFSGAGNGPFSFDLVGSLFRTGGYIPVEEDARGAADEPAGTGNGFVSLRFAANPQGKVRGYFRSSVFKEARQNGTRLQRNRTHTRRFVAGADPVIPDIFPGTAYSSLTLRAYAVLQVFDQTFSAVAEDRNSESLVRIQRVPSQSVGASVRLATTAGRHSLLAGLEADETRGASDEAGFFGGNATSKTGSGGRERTLGVYFQDRIVYRDRIVVTGRLRYDNWKNFGAARADLRLSDGRRQVVEFRDRSEEAVSPGISASVSFGSKVSAYFSGSGSFRAPSLNELYRGFRVGDVVTLPNEDLSAEHSVNIEGGIAYWTENFSIRAGGFSTRISDSITNVTVDASGSPILRQRRNASRVDVRGFEAEAEFRRGGLHLSAGYLFSDPVFGDFPSDPLLIGNRLPQTPAHSITARLRFSDDSGRTLGLQSRASSAQFDDDRNQFELGPYFQMDVFGSIRLGKALSFFVAAENVLNSRYTVGITPVRTVSAPFALRAGVRWN